MNCAPIIVASAPHSLALGDCACPESTSSRGDCACPESGHLPDDDIPISRFPRWQRDPALLNSPLTAEFSTLFNPHGAGHVALLNRAALGVLDAFEEALAVEEIPSTWHSAVEQLCRLGFLQPPELLGGGRATRAPGHPHTLALWLHVTNACNLACSYCYVHKSTAAMDLPTAQAAVDGGLRSAIRQGFQVLALKYAGGEATLNFRLIRQVHAYAAAQAAAAGIALQEVVLTNGVALSREAIAWLYEAGIGLSISLDGVGAAHDAQRPRRSGRGSFAAVARTIDRCLALGLHPDLSITVTRGNLSHLAETVRFALARELRFNLNFARDLAPGPVQDALYADAAATVAGVRAAFAAIAADPPRRRFIDGLLDRTAFHQPHAYACGAGRSYLVVNEAGRTAACQMLLEAPIGDVWEEDPLLTLQQCPDAPAGPPVTARAGCHACTWQHWCAGGCPLVAAQANGHAAGPSPYCAIYQELFPELIRLEGLRLLRWGGTGDR